MKTKFIYSMLLMAGLMFAGSTIQSAYGQETKKPATTKTTQKATTKTTQKATEKHPVVKYTCTMHPDVVMNKPGKCPKCGMALVQKKELKKEPMKMKKETTKVKKPASMKEMKK